MTQERANLRVQYVANLPILLANIQAALRRWKYPLLTLVFIISYDIDIGCERNMPEGNQTRLGGVRHDYKLKMKQSDAKFFTLSSDSNIHR